MYKTKQQFYRNWSAMMLRCYKQSQPSYKDYGGRGITVHEPWHDYFQYEKDIIQLIGAKPSSVHTVDRIDNNGNYEPGNIQWATRLQQNTNRRTFSNNKVGITGVSWHKRVGKWVAQIRIDGHKTHLGYFLTVEEAAKAYNDAMNSQKEDDDATAHQQDAPSGK